MEMPVSHSLDPKLWFSVGRLWVRMCRTANMKQGVAEKEHARLSQPGRAKDWKENGGNCG